jgi:exopolyphosphatase/guanosine-5'-triphosphate,3'-diphosphate pyrophosphatase
MKYAAIDIGTNAARLLVGEVTTEGNHSFVKKISYTRIPLRLGEEVFENGIISPKKAIDFIKTIKAFRLISEIFDVQAMRACATSAMREASNGKEIQALIEKETGVNLEIISGDVESDLIFGNFFLLDFDKTIPFVVIDVGGGSTEVNVFEGGERVASKSFNIGTIRMLKGKVEETIWTSIRTWLSENVDKSDIHQVFATGGNINKIHKMLGAQHMQPISYDGINELRNELIDLTLEQRVDRYQLKPDRADVIVPAMDIYVFIMNELKCQKIIVPKIGLSDGIIYDLYLQA